MATGRSVWGHSSRRRFAPPQDEVRKRFMEPKECAPMTAGSAPPVPQPVSAPLSRAAIFLVVTINPGAASTTAVRSLCADLSALLRVVEFRDIEAALSCVMGIGSEAWDR